MLIALVRNAKITKYRLILMSQPKRALPLCAAFRKHAAVLKEIVFQTRLASSRIKVDFNRMSSTSLQQGQAEEFLTDPGGDISTQ